MRFFVFFIQCSCFPVSAWASRSGLSVGGGTGTAEPLEAIVVVGGEGSSCHCLFWNRILMVLSRRAVRSAGDAEKALLGSRRRLAYGSS